LFQAVFLGGKFYEKENSIEEINEIIGFEEDKKAVLHKITYIYGDHIILRKSIHIVVSFRMNY
jgi:hypothetical protein